MQGLDIIKQYYKNMQIIYNKNNIFIYKAVTLDN